MTNTKFQFKIKQKKMGVKTETWPIQRQLIHTFPFPLIHNLTI